MKVYHCTCHSAAILREGFQADEGTDGTGSLFTGVWVSADAPLTHNPGAESDVVLWLDIPDPLFEKYEWVEEDLECKLERESFIPAAELNRYPIHIWDEAA